MNARGVVLITVLWIIVVISFISFSLAAAVRVEVTAAQGSFDSDRAFFMAKSAAEVMFRNLQQPNTLNESPVRVEEGVYIFPFASGEARVQLESNSNLIDINEASNELLASMFDSLRLEERLRNSLVDSIVDWRDIDDIPSLNGAELNDYGQVFIEKQRLPRNSSFETLDELLLVKYMTPNIFYGHVEFDEAAGSYRRIPGVRDLITLKSGRGNVDANTASGDVLAALPKISQDVVTKIITERNMRRFESGEDLVARIPELSNSETIQYLTTEAGVPVSIVSTATVMPSGASRTVHVDFTRERKKQILLYEPLIYKDIEVISFGRWRY